MVNFGRDAPDFENRMKEERNEKESEHASSYVQNVQSELIVTQRFPLLPLSGRYSMCQRIDAHTENCWAWKIEITNDYEH